MRGWTIDPSGLLLECRLPIERQLTNVQRVDSCTRSLIATADNRVPQNACPVCRAEIIVWEQLGEDDVVNLSKMPSQDEIRAKIIGLVTAAASKIALVLKEPGSKLARVIKAYAEK